jgi:hypothetical protein
MLSNQVLMEQIFHTALRGCDVDVSARRDGLWDATDCLEADVLRTLDPFSRERQLRTAVRSATGERQAGALGWDSADRSAWRRSQNSRIRLIGG